MADEGGNRRRSSAVPQRRRQRHSLRRTETAAASLTSPSHRSPVPWTRPQLSQGGSWSPRERPTASRDLRRPRGSPSTATARELSCQLALAPSHGRKTYHRNRPGEAVAEEETGRVALRFAMNGETSRSIPRNDFSDRRWDSIRRSRRTCAIRRAREAAAAPDQRSRSCRVQSSVRAMDGGGSLPASAETRILAPSAEGQNAASPAL